MRSDDAGYCVPLSYGKRLIVLALFSMAGLLPAHGESVRLRVVDNDGAPLADTVIMAPDQPAPVNPQPAIMDQINKTFVPHVLVVEQGRAVSFPNSDDIRHHVYSFSKPKPFEIKLYSGIRQAPIVFDKAGIVALGCNIHDWMIGYIVVSDTAAVVKTDNDGTAVLNISDRQQPVRVWHPRLLNAAQSAQTMMLPPPAADGTVQITLSIIPKPAAKPASGFGNRLRPHAN